MSKTKQISIKALGGLELYLDSRKEYQNGLGYDMYDLLIGRGKASNQLITRLYNVNNKTASKWRLIYKEEKERGKN